MEILINKTHTVAPSGGINLQSKCVRGDIWWQKLVLNIHLPRHLSNHRQTSCANKDAAELMLSRAHSVVVVVSFVCLHCHLLGFESCLFCLSFDARNIRDSAPPRSSWVGRDTIITLLKSVILRGSKITMDLSRQMNGTMRLKHSEFPSLSPKFQAIIGLMRMR